MSRYFIGMYVFGKRKFVKPRETVTTYSNVVTIIINIIVIIITISIVQFCNTVNFGRKTF